MAGPTPGQSSSGQNAQFGDQQPLAQTAGNDFSGNAMSPGGAPAQFVDNAMMGGGGSPASVVGGQNDPATQSQYQGLYASAQTPPSPPTGTQSGQQGGFASGIQKIGEALFGSQAHASSLPNVASRAGAPTSAGWPTAGGAGGGGGTDPYGNTYTTQPGYQGSPAHPLPPYSPSAAAAPAAAPAPAPQPAPQQPAAETGGGKITPAEPTPEVANTPEPPPDVPPMRKSPGDPRPEEVVSPALPTGQGEAATPPAPATEPPATPRPEYPIPGRMGGPTPEAGLRPTGQAGDILTTSPEGVTRALPPGGTAAEPAPVSPQSSAAPGNTPTGGWKADPDSAIGKLMRGDYSGAFTSAMRALTGQLGTAPDQNMIGRGASTPAELATARAFMDPGRAQMLSGGAPGTGAAQIRAGNMLAGVPPDTASTARAFQVQNRDPRGTAGFTPIDKLAEPQPGAQAAPALPSGTSKAAPQTIQERVQWRAGYENWRSQNRLPDTPENRERFNTERGYPQGSSSAAPAARPQSQAAPTSGDATAPQANYRAANAQLKLTPQEQALYQRHLDNLTSAGGVNNPDGTRSTIKNITAKVGGKTYVLPTVWDGKILPPDQAVQRARQEGLDKFPAYNSRQEAERRYQDMHSYMDRDTKAWQQSSGGAKAAPGPVERGPDPAGGGGTGMLNAIRARKGLPPLPPGSRIGGPRLFNQATPQDQQRYIPGGSNAPRTAPLPPAEEPSFTPAFPSGKAGAQPLLRPGQSWPKDMPPPTPGPLFRPGDPRAPGWYQDWQMQNAPRGGAGQPLYAQAQSTKGGDLPPLTPSGMPDFNNPAYEAWYKRNATGPSFSKDWYSGFLDAVGGKPDPESGRVHYSPLQRYSIHEIPLREYTKGSNQYRPYPEVPGAGGGAAKGNQGIGIVGGYERNQGRYEKLAEPPPGEEGDYNKDWRYVRRPSALPEELGGIGARQRPGQPTQRQAETAESRQRQAAESKKSTDALLKLLRKQGFNIKPGSGLAGAGERSPAGIGQ